ncbi:hypothetical protein EJ06DRAFT_531137 [Trichodelitschia bisporula]|uniref:Uncharacterized protein n=1 Tax=Trichodelitschia bisporula TaxID=703511 RepID=A0A6G1HUB6_9PEZI|nr:hypothetical protein EJ06DRAFT_531137 [Trichodelitschia bisporula]
MATQGQPANSYFVPGYGISRVVIQSQIRYYCGPDAIVRPFQHQGRDGFLVTTSGPSLTKEQIEDIKQASYDYETTQAVNRTEEADWYLNKPVYLLQRGRRQ